MPHTVPSQRSTRSSSNPNTNITLVDIKNLIENSKTEIVEIMKTEIFKLSETVSALGNRIEELERKNRQLEKEHSDRYTKLEKEVKRLQMHEDEKTDVLLNEMEQRIHRRGNVIVSGIPEQTEGSVEERKNEDREFIETLLNGITINESALETCQRLGYPRKGKPRPIRIMGLDPSEKMKILQKSKELKHHSTFKTIYINADLTPLQQLRAKNLRDELKARRESGEQDIVIYRGKIVRTADIKNFH